MNKAVVFAVALLCSLSLLGLSGCNDSQPTSNGQTDKETQAPSNATDAASDSTSVSFDQGSLVYTKTDLTVYLRENATTGYMWTSAITGSGIQPGEDTSLSANDISGNQSQALTGAGGAHLFTYKATSGGDSTITLTYARSWEHSSSDEQVLIHVTTDTSGIITTVSVK